MNRLQVRTEDGSLDGPAATASEVPNRRVLFSPYSVTARTRVLSFFLRSRFWPGPLAFSYVSIFISATFDSFFAPLRRFSIAFFFFRVFLWCFSEKAATWLYTEGNEASCGRIVICAWVVPFQTRATHSGTLRMERGVCVGDCRTLHGDGSPRIVLRGDHE